MVVIPDREAFSRLLLHRNAIQDHIPDAYMAAMQRLRDQLGERHAAAAREARAREEGLLRPADEVRAPPQQAVE